MSFDIDVNSCQQKASVAKSKLENHGKCFLPDAMLNMESWEPDFFLLYCMVHVDVVASPGLIAQLSTILIKIQVCLFLSSWFFFVQLVTNLAAYYVVNYVIQLACISQWQGGGDVLSLSISPDLVLFHQC